MSAVEIAAFAAVSLRIRGVKVSDGAEFEEVLAAATAAGHEDIAVWMSEESR